MTKNTKHTIRIYKTHNKRVPRSRWATRVSLTMTAFHRHKDGTIVPLVRDLQTGLKNPLDTKETLPWDNIVEKEGFYTLTNQPNVFNILEPNKPKKWWKFW